MLPVGVGHSSYSLVALRLCYVLPALWKIADNVILPIIGAGTSIFKATDQGAAPDLGEV